MWDWSGTKTPPPVRSRPEEADNAQSQGVTPMRRDVRAVPIYRNARSFRTLPPTAPAAANYPDPLNVPPPYVPQQPAYPPQQPYAPQGYPPQQQPYAPQQPAYPPQQPYAPQGYPPQQQPYAPQPPAYPPQQPYAPQGYPPQQQPYAPQMSAYPPQQSGYGNTAAATAQPYVPTTQPNRAYPSQNVPVSPYSAEQMNANVGGSSETDSSLWEWQFQQMGLPNMDLIEVDFVMLDPVWLGELRKAFKRTRRDFLKYVGYHHVNELIAAGMSDDAIRLVKKGKAPENYNIHVRVPFDYGGTNNFGNLVLIQTHPFHTEIHRFLDMQILAQPNFKPRKLYLPSPKGKVYFPGEIEVSSGGTSRHDRSVYAGFLESTFEMIAQRSSLGR